MDPRKQTCSQNGVAVEDALRHSVQELSEVYSRSVPQKHCRGTAEVLHECRRSTAEVLQKYRRKYRRSIAEVLQNYR